MGETLKKHANHGFTQFELSKNVLHNLKHFNLTPTGKLVLLVLVDCYNPENKAVVFPSIEFIANMAGVGLTATKQAIKDLINEGLIIKSKRSKIQGNYNKYLLTLKVQNPTSEQSENEFFKQSECDRFMNKNKQLKTKKEQTNNVVVLKTQIEEISDREILEDYAKKNGAENIQAYVNALYIKGVTAEIIKQYREKEGVSKYWERQAAQTSELIRQMKEQKGDPMPESFKALKAKLKTACKKNVIEQE